MKNQSSGPLKLILLIVGLLLAGAGYYLYSHLYSLQGRLDHIGSLIDTSYQYKLSSDADLDYIYKPDAVTKLDILLQEHPHLNALQMRKDALMLSAVKRQYQPWMHMAEYATKLITKANPDLNTILLPRSHTPELIFSPSANAQVYSLLENQFPANLGESWARAPFHYAEQDAAMVYLAAISRPDIQTGTFTPWDQNNPYYEAPPQHFDQTLRVLEALPFERIFGALPIDSYKPQKKKEPESEAKQENETKKETEAVITFIKPAGTTELYRMNEDKREVIDIIIRYDLVSMPVSHLKKPEQERKYTIIPGKTYRISAIQNFIYNKNQFNAELYTLRSVALDPERKINPWEPGNSRPRICLPPSP